MLSNIYVVFETKEKITELQIQCCISINMITCAALEKGYILKHSKATDFPDSFRFCIHSESYSRVRFMEIIMQMSFDLSYCKFYNTLSLAI